MKARAIVARITIVLIAALATTACRGHRASDANPRRDAAVAHLPARDASAAPSDAAGTWPELARLPLVEPVRVIALPARPDVPRFDVGGPTLIGDLAILASSQFGFLAVDFRHAQIAWTKPAGGHVAPPLVRDRSIYLVGECAQPPEVPPHERLLGCVRVVDAAGTDRSYVAIHGANAEVDAFADEPGAQLLWAGEASTGALVWRRGERAVIVDPLSGVAHAAPPTAATPPPLSVHYKERTWQIAQRPDGTIAATERGKPAWKTQRAYRLLLGAVYLPDQAPMIRMSNAGAFRGAPEVTLADMDATGSMHGQVAFPVPGIGVIGHAIDAIGDTALAVRLDTSLDRDYVVGYAANALIMWAYPLPELPRPDPVGVAIAPDAVVVFHDGDTLTVLPELSAPPTSPGAAHLPLENTTP